MAGSFIQRTVPLLLTLLLVVPAVATPLVGGLPDALAPPRPASTPAEPRVPDDLADATRLARLRPEVRAILEWHAEQQGWILLPPVRRDLAAADLPAAIDAFVSAFGGPGRDATQLLALRAGAGDLAPDLARALAVLLFALVDAQALQVAALAPLSLAEIAALAADTLPAAEAAALYARANLPLTLQAASTLDAAIAAAAPILQKHGALLALQTHLIGRPATGPAVAASLPDLAFALDRNPRDAPLTALAWTQALLAQRNLVQAALPAEVSLPWMLALYYGAMGIPMDEETILTLAALRGADPQLAHALALNLASGYLAWAVLQPRSAGHEADALSGLLPEVARIAAADGATASDLATLAQALDLAEASAGPGMAEAAGLLLAAADATRALQGKPIAPMGTSSHGAVCSSHDGQITCRVGDVRAVLGTHANGTNSVTLGVPGQERTLWGRDLKLAWDERICRLDVWNDVNRNGRMDGDATADGGERVAGTGATCDVANDVLLRDPYGYLLVTGEGSSVIDHRYGAVLQYTGRTGITRAATWDLWNSTWYGMATPNPVGGCFGFIFFRFGDCQGSGNFELFGLEEFLFVCFFLGSLGYTTGDIVRCFSTPEHLGRQMFTAVPPENVTINPDGYQILTLDLGGNDVYRSNAGGTLNSTLYETRMEPDAKTGAKIPVFRLRDPSEPYLKYRFRVPIALAIDLAGDDTYTNTREFVQGAADLGVGLLLDQAGNDRYTAGNYAHGAANTPGITWRERPGVTPTIPVPTNGRALALSLDLAGDDAYVAGDYSLAYANRSAAGILLNRDGRDSYRSGHQSQAFANGTWTAEGPAGALATDGAVASQPVQVGGFLLNVPFARIAPPSHGYALFLETSGADTYAVQTLKRPDGTSDWAQGRAVNGGVALLLDLAGEDSGLATNGGAEADDLLTARMSTRAFNNKTEERVGRNDNPRAERAGSRGFGLAIDAEVRDPARYPYAPEGYHLITPGSRFEMNEDPFFKLQLYIDAPGLLAIGATGPTTWSRDFVLAVDLGGNDRWVSAPGAARVDADAVFDRNDNLPTSCGGGANGGPLRPNNFTSSCPKARRMGQTNLLGVALDLDGADRYDVAKDGAGHGFLGVGMLYDLALREAVADDLYDLGRYSGGAGLVGGVGILFDAAGNDVYHGTRAPGLETKGLGFAERAGLGILVDAYGDDRYTGKRWVLGTAHVNSTYEAGIFVDATGTDVYTAPVESQGIFRHWPETRADQRRFPFSPNFTRQGSAEGEPIGGAGAQYVVVAALFIDDGFANDTYNVSNATLQGRPCLRFPHSGERCRGNDKAWTQDFEDYRPPGAPAQANEQVRGRGFDNLDAYLHAQFVKALDPSASDVSVPLSPTVLALRSILLSPSVQFTLPATQGEAVPPNANGQRDASTDTNPLPGLRGTVEFEVVAQAVDSNAVAKNAERVGQFLLYEEARRYTCDKTDPLRDPARTSNQAGLEQANTFGGPHSATPSYCGHMLFTSIPSTRSTNAAPENPAYPVLLPVLGAALELAMAALPEELRDPDWTGEEWRRAMAEAARLSAAGDPEGAATVLDDLAEGRIPGMPASTEHRRTEAGGRAVGGQPDRLAGTEDIRRVEFLLQERVPTASGIRFANTTLGACDLSGRHLDTASCQNLVPGVTTWFADNRSGGRCRAPDFTAMWGCFEMDWNTTARAADGTLLYPDGEYQLLVRAYYRERGVAQDTAAYSTEGAVNDRLSDNYGYYPGWARRLLYFDNLPAIYGATAYVGDFVPDDLQHGLVVFQAFASEPVVFQVWARAPGDADFLPIFGTSRNRTGADCFASKPAPAGCFSRLDNYYRTVDEQTGARRWCRDAQDRNVECPYLHARGAHAGVTALSKTSGRGVPVTFAWRPPEGAEGLYEMRIEMWDRTHMPDNSRSRGVQSTASFTFWGDADPPQAVPDALPRWIGVARMTADSVTDATPLTGRLEFAFDEDPAAAAGQGSRLESIRITATERDNRTGATATSALPPFFRGSHARLPVGVPVEHGKTYTLAFTAVDRAGNVQPTPTLATFTVDLLAPTTVPLAALQDPDPRMRPDAPVTLAWEAPSQDAVFGADLDRVEVHWSLADEFGRPLAWAPLPASQVNAAARTFRFDPAALAIPDDRRVEPYGAVFRVVAVDKYGNREGWNPLTREDAKFPDGPLRFDTLGPSVVGAVSRTPTHQQAELRWSFNEVTPAAWLNFTLVGSRTGGAGECSEVAGTHAHERAATVVTADRKTYRATLGALESHAVYEIAISGRDRVGNPMGAPLVLRFCTDPIANVTINAPFPNSILAGVATAGWTVRDVRGGESGTVLTYRLAVEADGRTVDLGEARCRGDPCFETPEGSRRNFDFDTRRIADAVEARLVLLVNSSANRDVPLRFVSQPFGVDNGAPLTTFRVEGVPGAKAGDWFKEPITVRFDAADPVSGVRGTYISTDNRTFQPATSTRLVADGLHTLWYNSTDRVGNAEKPRMLRLGVDTTAPEAALIVADGRSSVRQASVVAEIIAEDQPSGIREVTLTTGPGGTVETFGPERLAFGTLQLALRLPGADEQTSFAEIRVADLAGNVAVARQEVRVDGAAPQVLEAVAESTAFTEAMLRVSAHEESSLVVLLKRSTDRAFQARLEGGAPSTLHRLAVTRLFPSTQYEAHLILEDALGNRATGIIRFETRADQSPPGEVTAVSVADRAEGFLILEWRPATDDTGVHRYAVYRARGEENPVLIGRAPSTRYIDANLTPGVSYRYQIRAEDSAGNAGPLSSPVNGRATTRPSLIEGGVSPETGGPATVFRWTVTFRDLDGDRASFVRLLLNGKAYDMLPLPGQPADSRNGTVYYHEMTMAETRLSGGVPSFRFEASDGKNSVTTAVEGVGPMVVGEGHGAAPGSGVFSALFASVRGTPGAAAGLVILAVVGAAVAVLRRRWGA